MPKKVDKACDTSDSLHNYNCWLYFKAFPLNAIESIALFLPKPLSIQIKAVHERSYDSNFAYGMFYRYLFHYIEDHIKEIYEAAACTKDEAQEKYLDDFIVHIFENESKILEYTSGVIAHLLQQTRPIATSLKHVEVHLRDGQRLNPMSPAKAGSRQQRVLALLARDYRPQYTTSIPSIRRYAHQSAGDAKELRLGTQAQRKQGRVRVSPLFQRYLLIQALRARTHAVTPSTVPDITHVYFNLLAREKLGLEGRREKSLAQALECMQAPHLEVCTLPAAAGMMTKSDYKKTAPQYDREKLQEQFLDMVSPLDGQPEGRDIYLSIALRHRIFCSRDSDGGYSKTAEKQILKDLIEKSFITLNLSTQKMVSRAQRQAVWFHFVNYELPDYILTCLRSKAMNFTCRDGIDRGGVASVYYNLNKSMQPGRTPMTEQEFLRGVHAAPAAVKGRAMNHHMLLLWNAINDLVNAHYEKPEFRARFAWLIKWRDYNCPHLRADDLLTLRLNQCKQVLEQAQGLLGVSPSIKELIDYGLEILQEIQRQHRYGVSGTRLLLEIVVLTPEVILRPNEKDHKRYQELSVALPHRYPCLIIVAALIKIVLGVVLFFVPSVGSSFRTKGVETLKAACSHNARRFLQGKMASIFTKESPPLQDKKESDAEPQVLPDIAQI